MTRRKRSIGYILFALGFILMFFADSPSELRSWTTAINPPWMIAISFVFIGGLLGAGAVCILEPQPAGRDITPELRIS